jgi:uncharacterized OB-fold protein
MAQKTIDDRVLVLGDEGPRLLASVCKNCGNHMFPVHGGSCMRCTTDELETVELATTGTLWSWTIQGFPPKSPPYRGDADPKTFKPFGVGYVELDGQLRIESRLTVADPDRLTIGMEMELTTVALTTDDDGDDVVTFAFAPTADGSAT